jgi:hypothetical protein
VEAAAAKGDAAKADLLVDRAGGVRHSTGMARKLRLQYLTWLLCRQGKMLWNMTIPFTDLLAEINGEQA